MSDENDSTEQQPFAGWFDQWQEQQDLWLDLNAQAVTSFQQFMAGMSNAASTSGRVQPKNSDESVQATIFEEAMQSWSLWTEQLANGARFADLPTPHVDVSTYTLEQRELRQAQANFGKVISAAWNRAWAGFVQDNPLEKLRSGRGQDWLESWLSHLNKELLDTQRSDDFLAAQKNVLRANTRLRTRQMEWAEKWCEAFQIPTRTEIDDLEKTVHELKKELRSLKRELASTKRNSSS